MRARAYDCAEKNWVQYLRLRPTDSNAVANLGIVLNLEGRHAEAVAQFQKAISMGEGTYDLFAYYARSLDAIGRVEEAIDWSYKALEIAPDLVDVRGDLAKMLVSKGRRYEALSLLTAFDEKLVRNGHSPYFEGQRIAIESSIAAQPGAGSTSQMSFRATRIGDHFYVPVSLGGARSRDFVLDTGASQTTVSEEFLAASKVHYVVNRAAVPVMMANGRQQIARELIVASIRIGPVELRQAPLLACKGCAMLVGQSMLSRFDLRTSRVNGVEFMTLTPRDPSLVVVVHPASASKPASAAEPVSPALARARECLDLDEGLRAERERLEEAFKAVEDDVARSQQEGRDLAEMRRTLNASDHASVDAFNQRVQAHNSASEAANRRAELLDDEQEKLNEEIRSRNEKCGSIMLNDRDYATISKERKARRQAAAASSPAASAPGASSPAASSP